MCFCLKQWKTSEILNSRHFTLETPLSWAFKSLVSISDRKMSAINNSRVCNSSLILFLHLQTRRGLPRPVTRPAMHDKAIRKFPSTQSVTAMRKMPTLLSGKRNENKFNQALEIWHRKKGPKRNVEANEAARLCVSAILCKLHNSTLTGNCFPSWTHSQSRCVRWCAAYFKLLAKWHTFQRSTNIPWQSDFDGWVFTHAGSLQLLLICVGGRSCGNWFVLAVPKWGSFTVGG